jgi:hypothetical protein
MQIGQSEPQNRVDKTELCMAQRETGPEKVFSVPAHSKTESSECSYTVFQGINIHSLIPSVCKCKAHIKHLDVRQTMMFETEDIKIL